MKVGQQIQVRMDQLGVSVPELARRVGVSAQAVRHWVSGRSFPGKRHAPALESALSFRIDFTEGVAVNTGRESTAQLMERQDVELMLMISRLDPRIRTALMSLAEACLAVNSTAVQSFSTKEKAVPVGAFFEKGRDVKRSKKRASS